MRRVAARYRSTGTRTSPLKIAKGRFTKRLFYFFERLAVLLSSSPAITFRHSGLRRSTFLLRQATILSSFGICQKHRLRTSGVQADCSSAVPLWAKEAVVFSSVTAAAADIAAKRLNPN